jgi:hypothetical protein
VVFWGELGGIRPLVASAVVGPMVAMYRSLMSGFGPGIRAVIGRRM